MTPEPGYALPVSEAHQPPSEEQLATHRLSVLDAFLLAVEQRDQVLDVIADARDPEESRRLVADLLGIEEHGAAAQAVIELRLRSFSQSSVAELQAERDELKRRLGQGP
jgi:DNA gyrase/topoisomerase IV subunit A